jgi:hypothetical protein
MRAQEAERIVNEYGRVMHEAARASTAAPVSMLPYDKATIKQAILVVLAVLHFAHELSDKFRSDLRGGYIWLANFVDDERAECVREYDAAMLDSFERFESLPPGTVGRSVGILRGIHAEGLLLHAEFWEFEKRIGLRPASQDFDAMVEEAREMARRALGRESEPGGGHATKRPRPRWKFWQR